MKLSAMSAREQWLVVATLVVLLGGGYGLVRYRPALKALQAMQAQTAATEARLKTLVIPEEPMEDVDALKAQLTAAEGELLAARQHADQLAQRLAPLGSQDLKLKISDLAQRCGVRIRENEAYKVPAKPVAAPVAATAAKPGPAPAQSAAVVEPPGSRPPLEMLERFTRPGLERPLQRLSMEGSYGAIREFLRGLEKLPWQVTVAQLQLEVDERTPAPGYPQPLRATMILAL